MQPNQCLHYGSTDPITNLKKIHVLILDNSTHVTDLFKNILREFGFSNVFIANDGFQGVQIMRQIKTHLIIADYALRLQRAAEETQNPAEQDTVPLSGVDFVKRLRRSPYSPNPFIPIIMLTEPVGTKQVIAARDSGVNEIIIKPLASEELCKRITSVIAKPRIFITAEQYKGPCRRRKSLSSLPHQERRSREIKLVKCNLVSCT